MSAAWTAYRLVAPALGAAAPAARLFAPAAERPWWKERLGRVAIEGPVDAWIHAASLGEALAAGPLARSLKVASPGARFHLTATTRGGRERLGGLGWPHSLAPIDAPQAVARFMAATRPRRLFLIETELWPHWLLGARAAQVPVAVVSARLSPRSVSGYLRLGGAFRALVHGLGAVLAQSAEDAERWRALGAPPSRVAVVGNLKDDALPGPLADRRAARTALGLDPDRPLLVLGNLRPGEAQGAAWVWRLIPVSVRARWQVVAVPRHPHAAAGLRREVTSKGLALVADGAPGEGSWRWDERLGVLGGYYGAADLAVLGGTFLAGYRGHNPLEPASRGVPVLLGPHYESQAEAVAALLAAGAAQECTAFDDLGGRLMQWMHDEPAREAAGAAGLAVVAARRGAADRAVARLAEWALWPAS
jgi:3-deoxy-D-manno-octulosonic-acid transferase